MLALGMMSGTSLDGVDVVIADINGVDDSTKVTQKFFQTYDIPSTIKEKIRQVITSQNLNIAEVTSLNFELGDLFAACARRACLQFGIDSKDLAFIASHGQTVHHIPYGKDNYVRSTLQLGESSIIASELMCPVISNFREMDMALGGQGAPLVPLSEIILYQNVNESVALQNIGGIGNVTVIPPKTAGEQKVLGFDTGPGNVLINELMQHYYNRPYDKDGLIAQKGNIIPELVEFLRQHPFLAMQPPKSAEREDFGNIYMKSLVDKFSHLRSEDLIATATWFTAYCIQKSYQDYISKSYDIKTWVIGGGGAHNPVLLKHISELLSPIQVVTQDQYGYSSDAKEALAFLILGNQTWHKKVGNVPSVTGATKASILGKITYPPGY